MLVTLVAVLVAALGAGVAGYNAHVDQRTQARATAEVLQSAGASDVIVYCPDQLGPAVSRALEHTPVATVEQLAYPTLGAPERIDWTDYAQRNAAADPHALAKLVSDRTTGRVWIVQRVGYLTYGNQCEDFAAALARLRGQPDWMQRADDRYRESEDVLLFAGRAPTDG